MDVVLCEWCQWVIPGNINRLTLMAYHHPVGVLRDHKSS